MHVLMGTGTIACFVDCIALVHAPGRGVWLLGSIVLGAAYFTAFFWYVTRSQ